MAVSETAGAPARGDRKPGARGRRNLAVCAALLVAIAAGYAGLLMYFSGESDARSSEVHAGPQSATDRLDVNARLLTVDPLLEQAVVRMNFEPKGAMAASNGALSAPLKMFVNAASGSQERTFEKGKLVNPMDVTLGLYDGSVTDYPFDQFSTELQVAATSDGQPVPVVIDFVGALHGLTVQDQELTAHEVGGVTPVGITISRSPTTIAVAGFIMALLLAMSLAVLVVTLSVALWGRKVEPPIITLLGALLFGFVAFRNALPGTPPVGALSDYLAFFWAEGIVATCLFVLVAVYLKRLNRPAPAA